MEFKYHTLAIGWDVKCYQATTVDIIRQVNVYNTNTRKGIIKFIASKRWQLK